MTTEPDVLSLTIRLAAAPEAVFRRFTDPEQHVRWMGRDAVLEPVPDGIYRVRMRDGFAAAGRFLTVAAPNRIEFTWGWADDAAARHVLHERDDEAPGLPAGSTRVEVLLTPDGDGTRLNLRHHDLPTAELVAAHRVAWETYLGRLAVVVAGGDPGPEPHG